MVLEKRNVLRLDLMGSREGFFWRGRQRRYKVQFCKVDELCQFVLFVCVRVCVRDVCVCVCLCICVCTCVFFPLSTLL